MDEVIKVQIDKKINFSLGKSCIKNVFTEWKEVTWNKDKVGSITCPARWGSQKTGVTLRVLALKPCRFMQTL